MNIFFGSENSNYCEYLNMTNKIWRNIIIFIFFYVARFIIKNSKNQINVILTFFFWQPKNEFILL